MHAYQRPDGSYDLYEVEPKIVSAAEYAMIKRRKELNASKESHLAAIAAIDQELATLSVSAGPTNAGTTGTVATVGNETFKRKW